MQTLAPGTPFGAYIIEGLIAGGGMGSVYAARHTVYGTACALKVLHPKLHGDESWRKRFEAEGFAGTTLKHPHVLAARDVVLEEDDQLGLVLDLVQEGLTLHRVMSREYRTGVPLAQALRVFLGIVQGIEYAHSKEIVHGDIKPENVLIQGEFRDPSTWLAMVTDFGTIGILAHPVEIDGMPAVVVSPRYASPEHLKGMVHLEPRSDIYCLGLLLHYMVTGRHASSAKTVEEAAARVAKPTSTTPLLNLPESISVIFETATKRDRNARYQTARDLALAVRDMLDQLGEGLDLDDLQADLATEVVEERKEATKQVRLEAQQAAIAAANELEPGTAPEGDAAHQVSEVATPLGDLPHDDIQDSHVAAVVDASEVAESSPDPEDAEGPHDPETSDVVAIEGDDADDDVEQPSPVVPVESEDDDTPDLPDVNVEVLPDTDMPADVRVYPLDDPTEDVVPSEATLVEDPAIDEVSAADVAALPAGPMFSAVQDSRPIPALVLIVIGALFFILVAAGALYALMAA